MIVKSIDMKNVIICLLGFFLVIGSETRTVTDLEIDEDENNIVDDFDKEEQLDNEDELDDDEDQLDYNDNDLNEIDDETKENNKAMNFMQDEIEAEKKILDFMQTRYDHVRNLDNDATETCDPCMYSFTPLGCYEDKCIRGKRPIPELLDNHRTNDFDSDVIQWGDYEKSVGTLACHCAKKALAKSYSVFGLQFYGECFSGEHAHKTYNNDGKAKTCIDGEYGLCNKSSGRLCIGEGFTNFVYKLDPIPPPVVRYAKVGCFKDNIKHRALPHLLVNHRHEMNAMYKLFDWVHYRTTLIRLLHDCVKVAHQKGYKYIGLQFYGECWSGNGGIYTHSMHGPSEHCVNPSYKKCNMKHDCNCIGKGYANFVYRLF